jgi:hypothetical protein
LSNPADIFEFPSSEFVLKKNLASEVNLGVGLA